MTPHGLTNVPASVHQRLLNRAKRERRPLQELLQYFAIERFLYRLGRSAYAEKLLLKGATMLRLWDSPLARPTRDVDLLGRTPASETALATVIKDCFAADVPDDNIRLDQASVRTEAIRATARYDGARVRFVMYLGKIRLPVQVDVGFGDTVVPDPAWIEFPTLLDFPAPRLLAYPPESAVAEKFQIMVERERANTRMKDFYDIWILARKRPFDGGVLAHAIVATFDRRRTPLPAEPPLALTAEFAEDRAKQAQWRAFASRARLDAGEHKRVEVIGMLREFLIPPTTAIAVGRAFTSSWPAGGPWRASSRPEL